MSWILSLPLFQLGLNLLVAVIGMHYRLPVLVGKLSNGSLPIWSWFFWLPYILLSWATSQTVVRQVHHTMMPTEVAPNVLVGGYLGLVGQAPVGFSTENLAVIDVTCELPRASCLRAASVAYLNIPAWDGTPPTVAQIQAACVWGASLHRAGHRVLVHCAFGIGRSATMGCALLVALGIAPTWHAAFEVIRTKRPGVRLNRLYRKALDEWTTSQTPMASSSAQ
jgi:hypothetical protein